MTVDVLGKKEPLPFFPKGHTLFKGVDPWIIQQIIEYILFVKSVKKEK